MTRREARKRAFELIFKMDFSYLTDKFDQLDIFFDENEEIDEETKNYIMNTVKGVYDNVENIDKMIDENLKGWKFDRLTKVDKSILRLVVFEIYYSKDIPMGVAINEGIEITKEYSTDDAPSFINGVLGTITSNIKEV
ncbi:MAG: transcription antitermination factor NusB [Clostridia bacterium]|jgi:N utilization substance protein B|nr:transcription antitermination factor NusB [Clostridia bacterium]